MIVELCKTALLRLGPGATTLLDALRDREHSPVIKDCLDRCESCEKGVLVAKAGPMPLSPRDAKELLSLVDAEAAEDDE